MLEPAEAILFDFDYTLADSSAGVIDCVNYTLSRLGLPGPDDDAIRADIGLPLEGATVRLVGPDAASHDAAFRDLFVARADQIMTAKTVILAGVGEALTKLSGAGVRLGIVSTKFRSRIAQILEREGLLGLLDHIVGGEDVEQHKPDPEALQHALELFQLARQRVLYVGDSQVDAEAASRAGIRFVAVLSGVTPRETFSGYPVEAVLPRVRELPAALGL